jgi:hypothetical protein
MTIQGLVRRETKIDPKPAYQRGPVWSRSQKQLLIDSVLHDLDIPKFYLREISGPYEYEVVDGQQRLRAIWEFRRGEYGLSSDADPVGTSQIARSKYDDLSEDLKDSFDSYELSVVVLRDATLEDVEEMFLRLQNGTTLNAAEKRNAMPGNMKMFVRSLAEHKFFLSARFSDKRFGYDQVAAQMVLLELQGGPCNCKDKDLAKMYEDQAKLDPVCAKARKVKRTLDFLAEAFPVKTPEIEKKYHAVSLYLLASQMLEQFAVKDYSKEFAAAFLKFEQGRKQDEERPEDQRTPQMITYQEKTSHSTDSLDSLEYRHKLLMEFFLREIPALPPLDPERSFTDEQRLAIWRRDNGICQVRVKCEGAKCEWGQWEADHRKPWSKGGLTTVENGQVCCPPCNKSKSNSLPV